MSFCYRNGVRMIIGTCLLCRRALDSKYGSQEFEYGDEDVVLVCHPCKRRMRERGLRRDLLAVAIRTRLWPRVGAQR